MLKKEIQPSVRVVGTQNKKIRNGFLLFFANKKCMEVILKATLEFVFAMVVQRVALIPQAFGNTDCCKGNEIIRFVM